MYWPTSSTHKPSVNPVILTKVLALSQYISSTSGLNIAVALPLVHTSISLSKSLDNYLNLHFSQTELDLQRYLQQLYHFLFDAFLIKLS